MPSYIKIASFSYEANAYGQIAAARYVAYLFSQDAERGVKKMNIEFTRSFLLWCTVINYGVLLVWFLVFATAHDWMRRFHGRWFRLSDEQFDFLHYLGMSIYKIGILLFNLVPLVVLWIVA